MAISLGVATLAGTGGVAAIGPTGFPTRGDTAAWILKSGGARGLVTVNQDGLSLILAFQLQGLRVRHPYRLIASSKGCASNGGQLFGRDLTTNGKGFAWDPVGIAADASRIRSIRVRDRSSRTTVMCSGTAVFPLSGQNDTTKIKGPGATRGVVAFTEATVPWQIAWSMTGLAPNATYQILGSADDCTIEGALTFVKGFTTNARGTSLGRSELLPIGPVADIATGSIRLLAQDGPGTVVDCRVLN